MKYQIIECSLVLIEAKDFFLSRIKQSVISLIHVSNINIQCKLCTKFVWVTNITQKHFEKSLIVNCSIHIACKMYLASTRCSFD